MKQIYQIIFLLISFNIVFGQLSFEDNYLPAGSSFSDGLILADITGNGKPDVIHSKNSTSLGHNISMIRNNGQSSYSNYNVYSAMTAYRLFAADLDGDNDIDIISAHFIEDKVAWYENNYNGSTYFSNTQKNITNTVNGPVSIFAEDVDNDGDNDILVASTIDYTVAWYENLDGLGNFGTKQVIFNLNVSPHYVGCADFNGDGYKDVLIASTSDDKLRWYKNNGLGNFVLEQTITTFADGAYDAHLTDIDNDGDIDVISASLNDGKIAWYENMDGLGTFGVQQIISTNLFIAKYVFGGDLDNDGDQDILACGNNEMVWFENIDGLGNFGTKQVLLNEIVLNAFTKDFNQDGLLDIVYVTGNKLGWLKNLGVLKNEINGNVRVDANSNGCDTNDLSSPNLIVSTTNGTETLSTLSLNNSFYQLFPNEGNYITTITSTLPSYFNISPSSHNSNFVGYGATDNANFCIQTTATISDLSVSVYPLFQDPRPGSYITYQMVYRNNGTNEQNGNLLLQYDASKIIFSNANATVIQSSNTLSFNYSNLNPFEIRLINVTFYVEPFLTNSGDVLSFTATINPVSGDAIIEDNVMVLEDMVVNSYDPNDIRVLEGNEVHIDNFDQYLHYIIRFQNTGNADAININIKNILDVKLDWTTLQLESLSHNGRVEIKNGSQVNFIFDAINLPDSTNDEPNSHGYIAYKIKPLNTVQVGDIINNKADIFFDFNSAISTNTVATEFVDLLSIKDYDLNAFSIFPNPTVGQLSINSNKIINSVKVIDLQGRILKYFQFNNPSLNAEIDLTYLNKGIYILNIKSNNEEANIKVIKK